MQLPWSRGLDRALAIAFVSVSHDGIEMACLMSDCIRKAIASVLHYTSRVPYILRDRLLGKDLHPEQLESAIHRLNKPQFVALSLTV